MPGVSFIPCLTWVKQGKAKETVDKVKHNKAELEEIIKELKLKEAEFTSRPDVDSQQLSLTAPSSQENSDQEEEDEISRRYDMDHYDDDEEDEIGINVRSGFGIENLIVNNPSESDSEDSEAEADEFTVKPDDNLILLGHVDNDVCMLEVYGIQAAATHGWIVPYVAQKQIQSVCTSLILSSCFFNNAKAELFILHDIFLPSFPVCIEWLDFNAGNSENHGNLAAVGSMTPEINIWDLNVSGCLEAAFQLGGKKTKKSQRHKDGVLDLTWNPLNRNVLASASADQTVLLWDLNQLTSVLRISHFEDKVQVAKFNPLQPYSLLTGCYDGKARLYDCRSPTNYQAWEFSSEIERMIWNPFNSNCFFASTESGMVYQVDIRNQKYLWSLKAHNKEVSGLVLSSHCKDLLVTGSMDETVKIWDLKDNQPTYVTQKSMGIGHILALSNCPDVPYVFCAGGDKKDNFMYLWDIRENDAVVQRFQDRNLEEIRINLSGESFDNDNTNAQSMEAEQNEPRPCSSFSLLQPRANNQEQFEGAVKKRKLKSRKSLQAEETAGPSKASKAARRRKNRTKLQGKDHKKLHHKMPRNDYGEGDGGGQGQASTAS